MKNVVRTSIVAIALTAGLASAFASRAEAGVSFQGTFPLPHGSISIAVPDPMFNVGAFVPVGYRVFENPGYGYGFAYRDQFIPARRYGPRWVVYDRPCRFEAHGSRRHHRHGH